MKIDPKYFNRFIAVCALITAIIIIYSTFRFSQKQVTDFENSLLSVKADTLAFRSFSASDSLFFNELPANPAVIHFWSTWSGKSEEVGRVLESYSGNEDSLIVIAAAVRDSDEKIRDYIDQHPSSFYFVEGTDLFHQLLVPGMPSQIFLTSEKKIYDSHVGNDTTAIQIKLEELLKRE